MFISFEFYCKYNNENEPTRHICLRQSVLHGHSIYACRNLSVLELNRTPTQNNFVKHTLILGNFVNYHSLKLGHSLPTSNLFAFKGIPPLSIVIVLLYLPLCLHRFKWKINELY